MKSFTMSRFNFTGDLDLIRPRQFEFITEILEKKGYKGPEVTVQNVGAAGENYMSTVKRIIITENGETFKMIAKVASDNELMRAMAQTAMAFGNEELIYTELLPKFIELQRNAGVQTYRHPEIFGALSEEPNEIILLEDLKESNFNIEDRFKDLSHDCVKLVIKNMAVFHSMSYVLKHQEPENFDKLRVKFGDIYQGEKGWRSEEMQMFLKMLEESTMGLLADEYKKYMVDSTLNLMEVYDETTKDDIGSKHSVIQQGDGWINNIMFRFKDEVPEECILIDYQMAKESNPAFDIMYMLFSSTSHEQRLKHFDEYIDLYHKELNNSLRNYGLEASVIYPKHQLQCDLKRFAKFMFPICLFIINALTKTTEEAEKLKSAMKTEPNELLEESAQAMFDINPESAAIMKTKVEGLIASYVEFGYF